MRAAFAADGDGAFRFPPRFDPTFVALLWRFPSILHFADHPNEAAVAREPVTENHSPVLYAGSNLADRGASRWDSKGLLLVHRGQKNLDGFKRRRPIAPVNSTSIRLRLERCRAGGGVVNHGPQLIDSLAGALAVSRRHDLDPAPFDAAIAPRTFPRT